MMYKFNFTYNLFIYFFPTDLNMNEVPIICVTCTHRVIIKRLELQLKLVNIRDHLTDNITCGSQANYTLENKQVIISKYN